MPTSTHPRLQLLARPDLHLECFRSILGHRRPADALPQDHPFRRLHREYSPAATSSVRQAPLRYVLRLHGVQYAPAAAGKSGPADCTARPPRLRRPGSCFRLWVPHRRAPPSLPLSAWQPPLLASCHREITSGIAFDHALPPAPSPHVRPTGLHAVPTGCRKDAEHTTPRPCRTRQAVQGRRGRGGASRQHLRPLFFSLRV